MVMAVGMGLSIWLFSNQSDYVGLIPSHWPSFGDIAFEGAYRQVKIDELEASLGDRCDPPLAHELARQLVMDGRGDEAKDFAEDYTDHCGEDEVVTRWANAPLP